MFNFSAVFSAHLQKKLSNSELKGFFNLVKGFRLLRLNALEISSLFLKKPHLMIV